MADEIHDFRNALEKRLADRATTFARLDRIYSLLPITVDAVRSMRDAGANTQEIVVVLRGVIAELEAG